VSSKLLNVIRTVAFPTLAVAIALVFLPGHASLAVRVYVLVLSGYALALGVVALRRTFPATGRLRSSGSRKSTRRRPPATLHRIEQEVVLGISGSFDLHHRLRPRLRDLARDLLLSRRGVSLDEEPEAARRLVGDQAWELVRADRRAPEDRLARGIPRSELADVVQALERV
jgi:hypothetical protein